MHGLQQDEGEALGKRRLVTPGGFNRQPRLADAARPDEDEQTAGGVGQQAGDLSQFPLTATEGCGLRGRVEVRVGCEAIRLLVFGSAIRC